jgi:hypothetical protein
MYELDKRGLKYSIPEDYYCKEELFKLGSDNFKKVENLCNFIDSDIQLADHDFSKLNIEPAMFSFYNLKIIYDAITIRLFQLSKLFVIENPSTVYFYDSVKCPFMNDGSASYLFFSHKESLYSQLLSLNAFGVSQKKLPYIPDTDEPTIIQKESFVDNLKGKAKQYLSAHPELYDIALSTKKRGFPGFTQWINNNFHTNKNFPVLLYGAGYNWDDCNEDLRLEGIAPVYRITDDVHWLDEVSGQSSESMQAVWSDLQEKNEFKSFFVLNNIDFYPLIKERLKFLVEKMSLACLMSTKYIMDLIVKKNIKAVIASTFASCVGHSAALAAHNSKIPVITWQHGGYGAMDIHPIVNYCDLISSDAHFVFGEGVVDSYIQAARKYGTELIAVGSTSLESMDNMRISAIEGTEPENGKKILYATSSYSQNDRNISVFPPYSDTLFWQIQKSIVDILGKHKNNEVTVKLHPTNNYDIPPLQAYSIDCGYDHFTFIKKEKSYRELLQNADAVVIDFPFTTLLEALMIKKPVFAFIGLVYYMKTLIDCYQSVPSAAGF